MISWFAGARSGIQRYVGKHKCKGCQVDIVAAGRLGHHLCLAAFASEGVLHQTKVDMILGMKDSVTMPRFDIDLLGL